MRTLTFVLLVVAFSFPAHAQSVKDGNGLLDYCGHFVANLNSPSSQDGPDPQVLPVIASINRDKIGWCNGYLQATWEHIVDIKESEALGVRISGPASRAPDNEKKVVEAVMPMSAICFPRKGVSIAQMGRVLVKWLHDHPERLHESPSFLTLDALRGAFPCQADSKESVIPK